MSKKAPISFWTTDHKDVPTNDLRAIQRYIKPRSPSEVLGFFPPQEPEPSSLAGGDEEDFISQFGLTFDEFVDLAMQQPELWDEHELEDLVGAFTGDVPKARIHNLAIEYFTGQRRDRQGKQVEPPSPKPTMTLDEDLGEAQLEEPKSVMAPIPDMDKPAGSLDVGEWWSKSKDED